jgi:hypothetical protein
MKPNGHFRFKSTHLKNLKMAKQLTEATSAAAAKSHISRRVMLEKSFVCTTEGFPTVSVPVLSNTTAFTWN